MSCSWPRADQQRVGSQCVASRPPGGSTAPPPSSACTPPATRATAAATAGAGWPSTGAADTTSITDSLTATGTGGHIGAGMPDRQTKFYIDLNKIINLIREPIKKKKKNVENSTLGLTPPPL